MLILFYLIIFIEIFTSFYNLIKFFIFKTKNKNSFNKSKELNLSFKINILIPCYEEQKVIKQTLLHFQKIIKNNSNIDLYVITTNKENNNRTFLPSTYECLTNLKSSSSLIFNIINYPSTNGMMADQINYAINEILSKSTLSESRIYFSLYNADSHPDFNTFNDICMKIQEYNFPNVIQQYSNNFSNYNKLSFLMKGFAIYQTAFELRSGLINNQISSYLYSHVVGHGLTIRADYIRKLNGFNTDFWCEDIFLTGLLYNNHEKIIPLNSLDNSETPRNLKIQVTQNAVWFKTASQYIQILKSIKKQHKISKMGYIWLLHELRATFIWFFMPFALLYSLIFPIIIGNYYLLILSLLFYSLFVFTNYFLNLLIVNSKRFIKYLKNYFSCFFAIFFTNIGPIYSIFLRKKIKTER